MSATNNEIYNAEEMLIQCMNDKDIFYQFLVMAIETLPSYKSELMNAIENNNLEEIAQKAHKLKSFTGNIKLTKLNSLLISIEQEAKDYKLDNINSKYDELINDFENARIALVNELSKKQ